MKRFNKGSKVFVIIILTVFILLSLVACGMYSYLTSIEFDYIVDEKTNTVTITGIGTDDGTLIIPETIEGRPVISIADYAFQNNSNLVMIKFPDTISYIGKGAFYNCENLIFIFGLEKCIELKSIESETFKHCNNLHTIKLPNSITSIGSYVFQFCGNLRELSIPNSVTYIGKAAFSNCLSIKEFKIPQGVTSIEDGTFLGCASMESITLPEGITHIGLEAFSACKKLKFVAIPSTVTTIGDAVFTRCYSLLSIDVAPDNPAYASIDGVLYNKNLTELTAYPAGKTDKTFSIPKGVTTIVKGAFSGNKNLDTLNIPKDVNSISNLFLYETLIKTINYEGSVSDWNKIVTISTLDCGETFDAIICTDGQIAKDGTVTYK